MSVTLADPYRDYTIDYAQHAASCKPEEHESTLVYHHHQTQSHHLQHPKQNTGSPFAPPPGGPQRSAFEQQQQQHHHHANATVLPTAANPQPSVHELSQSVVLNPAQMLPRQQLPVQYPPTSFDIPPLPRGTKRHHSETEGDGGGGSGSGPGGAGAASSGGAGGGTSDHHTIRRQLPVLAGETHSDAAHSSDMLFSVHGGESSQHPAMQSHDFAAPPDSMALPQHHHHHRLPPHASLRDSQRHGMNIESSPLPSGPPSVVGQPGMPEPAPRPRGPKLKFTPEEDALLVELKENKNLTWKQIADFFPGRTSGTLQVRYCTKLKAKDVAWSDEMVQRLQRAMQEYENDRWRIIAGKVGNGFTPAACREKASQL